MGKNICISYISDKRFVSRTYETIQKTNILILKWAKDLNRCFPKDDLQIAKKCMKRCSA